MRKDKGYSVDEVLNSLNRKHDLKIEGNQIKILNGKGKGNLANDIGIRSQGKIDFLCNYKGYRRVSVGEFQHTHKELRVK